MTKSHDRRQCSDARPILGEEVVDYLHLPVVVRIAYRLVAIARNFPMSIGDGRLDWMGMQVAPRLGMDKPHDVTIFEILDIAVIVVGCVPDFFDIPLVIGVLVVVAGDLLLPRTARVGLDM